MQSRDFCYWLQGYFEINGKAEISQAQATMIKNHLNMVFKHELEPSSVIEQVSVPFSTVGFPKYDNGFFAHVSC